MRSVVLFLAAAALLPACGGSINATPITQFGLDVQAGIVSGDLTLNGGNFPANGQESGELWAQGPLPEDRFLLGSTVNSQYSAMLVHGTYDFLYRFKAGGAQVPLNDSAVIHTGLAVAGDAVQDLNVPKVTVGSTLTLNGAPFPASIFDSAWFYLQPVGTSQLILLAKSHLAPGTVRVVPGQYHVLYDYFTGDAVPVNKLRRVLSDVAISSNTTLVINVVASSLRVGVTLNGSPFPLSEYEDANIALRDGVTGSISPLFNTKEPLASVLVIDGTYDLLYLHETGSETVPVNVRALLIDDLSTVGGAAVLHDIVTVTVDLDVTHNGNPFPLSEYDDGNLYLYDPDTQTDTLLGNSHDALDQIILIPGTYDVYYSHETGADVPQNVRGLIAAGVAVAGPTLDLDVTSHLVTVNVTRNGAAFPVSEYDDANLFLVGSPSATDILVGNTHDGELAVRVMTGTYDLYYRHETGETVPQTDNYRILAGQAINADADLAANLVTRKARLSATLNGAPFPQNQNGLNAGRLYAASGPGERVLMLRTHEPPGNVELIVGDYEFFYEYADGPDVPRNAWVKVGEGTLSP